MSHQSNDELMERARQVKIDYEGTDLELAIDTAIENNDLEHLEFMVREAEFETAAFDPDVLRAHQEFEASKLPTDVLQKELDERDESDVD
jgi:hypothetical protein